MARTAVATLQTIWDCRWSQPGHRLNGVPDAQQPEGVWVCVREEGRRTVDEEECATCTHWELEATANAIPPALAPHTPGPTAVGPLTTTATRSVDIGTATTPVDRTLHLLTWGCIVFTAILLGATGLTVLTSPLAIPVAITLWLTGAAIIGFAVTGHLPDRRL